MTPGRGYWIPPGSGELFPRPRVSLSAAISSRAALRALVTRDMHAALSMGIGGRSAFIDTEGFNDGRGCCCAETLGESLLKVVPLNEMPESLMFREFQSGRRRREGLSDVYGDCAFSAGLYDLRSRGDEKSEERVRESVLDQLSNNTAGTGLVTPFFSFSSSSTRL